MQLIAAAVLQDDEWVQSFLAQSREILKRAHDKVAVALTALQLPFQKASAGLFIYVDMVELLPEYSWEGEEALTEVLFNEGGIVLTPGRAQFSSTPGSFRICTVWNSEEAMDVAVERIKKVVSRVRERGWVQV
mmetsp:Transcript_28287/g.66104  ORF Transcript_28287/g.66104 Transcript_28287/m.66104 type:complete len:133 (+) Transcript_28287:739-1137(+)